MDCGATAKMADVELLRGRRLMHAFHSWSCPQNRRLLVRQDGFRRGFKRWSEKKGGQAVFLLRYAWGALFLEYDIPCASSGGGCCDRVIGMGTTEGAELISVDTAPCGTLFTRRAVEPRVSRLALAPVRELRHCDCCSQGKLEEDRPFLSGDRSVQRLAFVHAVFSWTKPGHRQALIRPYMYATSWQP